MKEQIKAPEKIQLSDEEIANLSGCSQKWLSMVAKEEKVKAMKSELQKNV